MKKMAIELSAAQNPSLQRSSPFNLGEAYGSPWGQTRTLGHLVSLFLTAAISIAGIICLFLIIGGGISIIASAGKDDPQGAAQGKSAVTMGIVGFIIVIGAYWVIRIIENIVGYPLITAPSL